MAVSIKKIARAIATVMLLIIAIWWALKISDFSSLSASDAKSWLRISDRLLLVSAVLVVLGLFGEFSDSEEWKKSIWYEAAKWAVIVGIFLELFGDAGVFQAGDRVQEIDESVIRFQNDEIIALYEHARPRAVKPEMANALRKFAEEKYPNGILFAFLKNDPEAAGFAADIAAYMGLKRFRVLPLDSTQYVGSALFFAGRDTSSSKPGVPASVAQQQHLNDVLGPLRELGFGTMPGSLSPVINEPVLYVDPKLPPAISRPFEQTGNSVIEEIERQKAQGAGDIIDMPLPKAGSAAQ
jgi:hypothetical protein